MTRFRRSGLSLLVVCSVAGCVACFPVRKANVSPVPPPPVAQVVNTFPSVVAPDEVCVEARQIAAEVCSRSSRVLTDPIHLVLIFDVPNNGRISQSNLERMQKIYDCLLEDFILPKDRLSVVPYAYNVGYRFTHTSWYQEIPEDPRQRAGLPGLFRPITVEGNWDWNWAVADVINRINEDQLAETPTIVVALSDIEGGKLQEAPSLGLPEGSQQAIDAFTGGLSERTTLEFPSGDSTMYAHILLNRAALRQISGEYVSASVELVKDGTGPVKVGEPVTLRAVLHGPLLDAAKAGKVEYYWDSDGEVLGGANPASDSVTWTYTKQGVYKPRVAVHWIGPGRTDLFTSSIEPIQTNQPSEGGSN